MELAYSQCGDYLLTGLVLEDMRGYHIDKYGRMHRAYLKEHHPALYSSLLLTEKLFPHFAEIAAACHSQPETIEAADQMEWVRFLQSFMPLIYRALRVFGNVRTGGILGWHISLTAGTYVRSV